MSKFLRIASGVDTLPVMLELHRAPHLWDLNTHRQSYPGTPHGDTTSIWVRYRPEAEIKGLASFAEEHRNIFWPAWRELPSLRPLVFNLMTRVCATELGLIIITRIPPGGEVLPHSDKGGWAPFYYNCKAHVILSGSSLSTCEDEAISMQTGDVWTFDNLLMHAVKSTGDQDRICAIVAMRCEP